MSAVTVSNEREIDPFALSVEQLAALKSDHEDEIAELKSQMEALFGAKNRFVNARSAVDDLIKPENDGATLLVPLTSSLYVPGKIVDPNKVVVELGTGYYCDKDSSAAKELVDRKISLVNKSIESIENVMKQKRKSLDVITQVLQYKLSQAQKQPQK